MVREQLDALSRRLELKKVRRGKEDLPGVVGFRGRLLVDCNLEKGRLRLQIVPLRAQPLALSLRSGAPSSESLTIEEPSLKGRLRASSEYPARALRILYAKPVRESLQSLLDAGSTFELTQEGLVVSAAALDAEAGLPIATAAIRLMESMENASREEALRAETEKAAAKQQPLPEGPVRGFVRLTEVDDEQREKLRREARALVFWRKSPEEVRARLVRMGASESLAQELHAEFAGEYALHRRALPLKDVRLAMLAGVMAVFSAVLFKPPRSSLPVTTLSHFVPTFLFLAAALALVGRGIVNYLRDDDD